MKPILDYTHQPALDAFFASDTLLAFDYDGTLAPIVSDPDSATMRQITRELLVECSRRYPTILLTGRARIDVIRFVAGIPLQGIIGNHGSEGFGARPPGSIAQRVADWREDLLERLESLAGISIEDKRYSLAIHYRASIDPHNAERRIRTAAAALDQARLVGGKAVLNIVPQEAPNKADALLGACERLGFKRALYVGDDDSDEDVFSLRNPDRVLGVRVGRDIRSAAEYYLEDQEEMDQLLALLAQR